MYLGAAWYPEHWPEARWAEDVRLMRECGMNVARLAEFAWSTIEPSEGQYQLDWLDRAIGLLSENGIAVVLGTPTAAPPAWLTYHNPDTVATDEQGRRYQHGNRCHYAPGSQTYHKYVRRVVEQMAKRFGADDRVIGWQIDNEYSRVDYSETSRRQFQAFLRARYASLADLNERWSTAYWSQTYTDWHEIPLPIGPHNPGLMLDHRRFVTRVWRDFQHLQIESIRQFADPRQFITHNFMGWFDGFDHYELSSELDIAAWDWYVPSEAHEFCRTGAAHDLTRGFKRRNFWVMEAQPGHVNWAPVNRSLARGESRCMAWHAIGHGADAVLYWQWRSAPGGQEQLHGSVIGADGRPRPVYDEIREIGSDLRAAGELLDGSSVVNEVAFLHSYDSRWSLKAQRHHAEFDPVALLERYYAPFAKSGVGVDIISSRESLDGYRVVVAPALALLSPEEVERIVAFVSHGGTLVLTVRCAQKDYYNALFPLLQPGPLREIAGVEVIDYYALPQHVPVNSLWSDGGAGQGSIWAEPLRPISAAAKPLALFGESDGWLDGAWAAAEHCVGQRGGRVITVGAVLDHKLQHSFTNWLMKSTGLTARLSGMPGNVELTRRVSVDGLPGYILINHGTEPVSVQLPADTLQDGAHDALTQRSVSNPVELGRYGVCVIVPDRA